MYAKSVSPKTFTFAARLLLVLVVFALFLALTLGVQTALAGDRRSCRDYYTVKSGDSLAKIAGKYRVHWRAIVEANGLKDPYTLFVGDSLCIPGRESGDYERGKAPTDPAASFTVTYLGRNIQITTYNFPKRHEYNVKVDDAGDRHTRWSKVGILSVPKNGNTSKTFELPSSLRNEKRLNVCLKDRANDALICRIVTR